MALGPGAGQKSPLSWGGEGVQLLDKLSKGGSQENGEHVPKVGYTRTEL